MKKALITLGSFSMLLTPLISISCGDDYTHEQLDSFFNQFEQKTLYTYKPNLSLSSLVATSVGGKQYKLSDLGIPYVQEASDLTYTAYFDMFDRYSEELGYIDVNIKITDKKFGGETGLAKKYQLWGFTPTNSNFKSLTDFSYKVIQNQRTTLVDKNIIDYFDSANPSGPKVRTAEELGLTLPAISDGLTVTITDETTWYLDENNVPWFKDELYIKVVVSVNAPELLPVPISETIYIKLKGFVPSRELPEIDNEFPEDDELDAYVNTLPFTHTTVATGTYAYQFVDGFKYKSNEIGFPNNGNEFGWNIYFTIEEVNIYTGTIVATMGAEALPGTLTNTIYNYNSDKLFTFTGFKVVDRG